MAAFMYLMQLERAKKRERIFRDRSQLIDIHVFNDEQMIARYRFSRQSVCEILDLVQDDLRRPTQRSHAVSPSDQVFATLRFLAKGDFQSEAGDVHGISQPTMSRCIMKVIDAINSKLKNVKFPQQRNELGKVKEDFFKIAQFPNVVGCIDGTLIPIQGMTGDDEHLFVCRKGFHAINVQAVVDPSLRFTNIVCKFGGATHDAYILSDSFLPNVMENLPGGGWLLGDSGYPLKTWLMTPVLNPRNSSEEKFNRAHSKTRNIVERGFGVLKARFICLHKSGGALSYTPEKCVKIIECCFRLHNKAVTDNLPLPAMDNIIHFHHSTTINESNREAERIRNVLIQRFQ